MSIRKRGNTPAAQAKIQREYHKERLQRAIVRGAVRVYSSEQIAAFVQSAQYAFRLRKQGHDISAMAEILEVPQQSALNLLNAGRYMNSH